MHYAAALVAGLCGITFARSIPPADRSPDSFPKCRKVSPTPDNKICGTRGDYYLYDNSDPYRTDTTEVVQRVDSLIACASLAAPIRGYAAFGYNTQSGLCTLYIEEIDNDVGSFSSDPKSNTIYYDSACFDCNFDCPLKFRGNLLQDESFDDSAKYIGPWFRETITGLSIDPKPNSVKVVSPGNGSPRALNLGVGKADGATLRQFFPRCGRELYSVKFDYRIDPPAADAGGQFVYSALNADSTALDTGVTDGWVTTEDLFYTEGIDVINSAYDAFLYVQVRRKLFINETYTPPNVFLDNFDVRRIGVAPGTPEPGSDNAVVNGDFESGVATPFVIKDTSVKHNPGKVIFETVSPGLKGSEHAFKVTSTKRDSGYFTIKQKVSLVPGKRYLFSIDVAGDPYSMIAYIGGRTMYLTKSGVKKGINKTFTVAFVPQVADPVLTIESGVDSFNGEGSVTLDNISIRPLA